MCPPLLLPSSGGLSCCSGLEILRSLPQGEREKSAPVPAHGSTSLAQGDASMTANHQRREVGSAVAVGRTHGDPIPFRRTVPPCMNNEHL